MISKFIFTVTALLFAFAGSTVAIADSHAVGCQKIFAKAKVDPNYISDCEFDGTDYSFCIAGDLKGSLKGTWVSYLQDEWVIESSVAGLPEPVEFYSNYGREFEVFTSTKGNIYGDAHYIFDYRLFDTGAKFPLPVFITGGTGRYEGASGWMIVLFNTDLDKARISGEVCGPYIPKDDDDDSDDDD